jgi:CoA-transferase family III
MPRQQRRGRSTTRRKVPLEGILVADFSRILAGPLCTQLLSDSGARVIEIEEPGRGWALVKNLYEILPRESPLVGRLSHAAIGTYSEAPFAAAARWETPATRVGSSPFG